MKKLIGLIAIAGLCWGGYKVFGSPSKAQRAAKACSNIAEMCADGDFTKHDVEECTSGLQETPPADIAKEVDKAITCTADANSCGEIVGCLAGAGTGLDNDLRDFAKGFDRARKH